MDNLRELYVEPYRILYTVEDDDCLIIAIVHARRDMGRVLRQRGFPPPDSPN
jgi:hypothetical protein